MTKHAILKAPPRIVRAALGSIGLTEMPAGSTVELVIRADATRLRLRSFATYLHLVDRFYGRQDPRGLRSYAQRRRDNLEINEIRLGSIEFVISGGLDFISQHHLVLTWILLRGIPHAGRAVSQTFSQYAAAYRDYEAGRHARAQRRELEAPKARQEALRRATRAAIREFLEEDPNFRDMAGARRVELARLMAEAYVAEEEHVRTAKAFAKEHVQSILLRVNGNELP